jgi:hypothetical protein
VSALRTQTWNTQKASAEMRVKMKYKFQFRNQLVIFLTILLIFLVLYFISFESTHFIHNCTGEDCPICHEMIIAESMIKLVGLSIITISQIFFFAVSCRKNETVSFLCHIQRNLIIDKVRMDD